MISGFHHQVGGHFGILKASASCVCKPLNQRELNFYSQLSSELLPYTPKFYGKIRVAIQTAENGLITMRTESAEQSVDQILVTQSVDNEESEAKPLQQMMTFWLRNKKVEAAEEVTNFWAKSCQSKVVQKLVNGHDKFFILLEDVVSKFSRPCVVDLKMGTRQYGQNSSEEKRLSQQQKCRQSTSEKFGVRMVGMQLYDKANDLFHYVNKYEGRRMNSASLSSALTVFLVTAGVERTKRLLSELEELKLLMYRLEGYRFFSSSLLIGF
ncbi:Kinase [Aphelenchoides bicaudatus]|nr:Kinase [Aphelenchoides bicaudatus]